MRIALAHKQLNRSGGTERDLYRTAEGLRDLGHEIHLFCGEYGVKPPPGTIAHRVPLAPFGRTARLWSFAALAPRIIRRYKCDVIVSFGRMIYQDVLRSGGGSHKLFLEKMGHENGVWRRLWQRASIYHQSLLAMEKRQFQAGHYKTILAVSDNVKRELISTYSVPQDKIAVIYNGVDQQRFHPSLRQKFRDSVRRQWGIPLDAAVVLFVGSGFRRKGLDRLFKVWSSPRLKGAYLLVVGDDAQRRRYRVWAEADGRVVFAGRQEDVERYYGAADLVALPAVQEAFGNVVLEALACGLPVLVSKAVGASEVLRGALADGILGRPEDSAELEAKLLSMLDQSRRPSCSEEARKLAEEYSWKNHFRKLETHLQGVVGLNYACAEVPAPLSASRSGRE
ncbi:MAG TPA: glycosyltransferase family 4 protein [Candidatus Binatia bacterium]|nr:glycosyltransferase family 4 protein [Candidatus Binatia bacterium]